MHASRLYCLYAFAACLLMQSSLSSPLDPKAAALAELSRRNLTFTIGHYDANNPISKRSVPPECSFETRVEFSYLQFTGLPSGQVACIGWDPTYTECGQGTWPDPDFTDIQTVLEDQVALDGAFASATVGHWTSTFGLFTTAFSNRDTALFGLGLANAGVKSMEWYWCRDDDFATVIGYNDICP